MARFTSCYGGFDMFVLLVVTMLMVGVAQGTTWQLKWKPNAASDGLHAFQQVQDDPRRTDPGVKHIYVQGSNYRFDMPLKEREYNAKHGWDRQRNEVLGMVDGVNTLKIQKGETWRLQHHIYIPQSLEATTTFTHIMQLFSAQIDSPMVTMSLQQVHNVPTIQLELMQSATFVGSTALEPLQETWIQSWVTFTASDNGSIQWILKDSNNVTVVNAQANFGNFPAGGFYPKWGIYRSIEDPAHLKDCFMLITNFKAYQQVNSSPNLAAAHSKPEL